MEEHIDDLELKDLGQYYGSVNNINVLGIQCTEGIQYIMNNGYSWLVTDLLPKVKFDKMLMDEEFLSIELKLLADKGAQVTIGDGNGNVLHTQDYAYTDAKVELKLFLTNGVLMLAGEY